MVLRMYEGYWEERGFKVERVDQLGGDEGGVKSVRVLMKGDKAYGYLKGEKGVDGLVGI